MAECSRIVSMLSEYLERDLPDETCASIDDHLRTCRECGDAAASLRLTVDLCRRFRAEDRPGPLAEGKQQELRAAFEKALEAMRPDRSRR